MASKSDFAFRASIARERRFQGLTIQVVVSTRGSDDEDFDWIRVWRRYMPSVVGHGLRGYFDPAYDRHRRTSRDVEHATAAMYAVGWISALEDHYKNETWWHGVVETDQLGKIDPYEEEDYAAAYKLRNALVHTGGDLTALRKPATSDDISRIDSWDGVSVDPNGVVTLEYAAVDHFSKMFLAMTNEKDGWH